MKRLMGMIFLAVVALLLILIPVAMAEEAEAPTAGTAYDWAQLATIAGATAATLLIVQFIKLPLDEVWHVPTRAVVYVIALLIMLGAKAFTAGLQIEDIPLLAINAFVVALAAMGSYEMTFAPSDRKPPDLAP